MTATNSRLASAARVAERAIKWSLLAVFAVGVRRRNPGAVVNSVASLAGTALPSLIERRYGVELRPWQRVYAKVAMLTHAVGMLGPYDDTWWWDHLTHAHSASLLGGVVHVAARRRGRDPGPRVLAAVGGTGVLWELMELAIHRAADRVGLEPLLVSYGRNDIIFDLLFDLWGALLVLVVGDRALDNLVDDRE